MQPAYFVNNNPFLSNGVKARRNKQKSRNYSDLHRYAGRNITMLDVDSIEFDMDGNSLAVIECKHYGEQTSLYQNNCMKKLGNDLSIPTFIVRHDYEVTSFTVYALNDKAESFLYRNNFHDGERLNRKEYLTFLHAIHGGTPTEAEIEDFESFQAEINNA